MAPKVGINGFGRIGRLVFRQLMEDGDLEVAGINDIAPLDNLAYLLRHDSAQRPPDVAVTANGNELRWGDTAVAFSSEHDPGALPWADLGVEVAVEATGLFRSRDDAAKHLRAGADRVVITAPAKGPDVTICMGVNHHAFEPAEHRIISNASCTTNCLAPVARVLHDRFGVVRGLLTTVHAYTSSQGIVDQPASKWRRGRAGAVNIVPTTTGAAVATAEVIPELEGRLDGLAVRVPVPVGSIIDFVATTQRSVSVDAVIDAFREAASSGPLEGILGVSDEELVSSDIVGCRYSALVDAPSTMVLGDNLVKVLAWYDNERGYARRVADLVGHVARR
ncbi:MAG TPA: type I glyceraldehyde-3-phosphate dehydrogenase [Methylomirabilota bacterium]|nr:type I glyceraldehyde-3-phosphate dehydrogenase [Methylomirabilota bacterium]